MKLNVLVLRIFWVTLIFVPAWPALGGWSDGVVESAAKRAVEKVANRASDKGSDAAYDKAKDGAKPSQRNDAATTSSDSSSKADAPDVSAKSDASRSGDRIDTSGSAIADPKAHGQVADDSRSMLRGNPQRSGKFSASGVPALKGVKWKAQVGGRGGPLAVGDGVLCMGRSVYEGLYAFDAATGKQLWVYKTGNTNSTPAIANGSIYFGERDLKTSGKDGGFIALDLRSGKKRWRFATGVNEVTSPLVIGEAVYVTSQNGYLYALDRKTGEERWRFRFVEFPTGIPSSPVMENGNLYFWGGGKAMGSRGRYIDESYLFVIDPKTGREKHKFDTFLDREKRRDSITVSDPPVVVNGTIYFSSRSSPTVVCAMDAEDGSYNWCFTAKGYVTAPAVADGVVYFSDNANYLYAVDARSGREKWKYATEGAQISAPSVANGLIYFGGGAERITGNGNYLYAMDIETRQVKWKFETDQPSPGKPNIERWSISSPVVVGDRVYFSCWTYVYCIH